MFGLRHEGNVGREAEEEEDELVVELVEKATVKVAKKKEIRAGKLVGEEKRHRKKLEFLSRRLENVCHRG